MASFDKAVEFTLASEGVFSNDANDHGGKTKYGITEADMKEYQRTSHQLSFRRIEDLTRGEAVQIYRARYWRYDDVLNDMVATKLFDIGVNMGPAIAPLLAQKAVNFIGDGRHVKEDGVWGPQTLMAVNLLCLIKGEALKLHKALTLFQAQRYVNIVLANRTQLEFIDGWIHRAGTRPPA